MNRNICILMVIVAAFAVNGMVKSNVNEFIINEFAIMEGTEVETEVYVIDSQKSGPTVLMVGGIHGDEIAGIKAAEEFKNYKPPKGKLAILPKANKPAYEAEKRTTDFLDDLNRNFPGLETGTLTEKLAWQIVQLVDKYQPDVVIDFHESRGSYADEEKRLGDSIIFTPQDDILEDSMTLVLNIVDKYNTNFNPKVELTFLSGAPKGSLNREVTQLYKTPVITIETSRKLPLEVRKKQHIDIANIILDYFEMKSE